MNRLHDVVQILKAAGWKDNCDAQWSGIEAALPELAALLSCNSPAQPVARDVLKAFAGEALEWRSKKNKWGAGAGEAFDAIADRYASQLQPEHVPLTAAGSEDQAVYASIVSNYHQPPAVAGAVPDTVLAVASALASQYLLRNSGGTLHCMHCLHDCENRESHDKDCPVLQARAIVNDSLIAAAPQAASCLPAEMTPAMMRAVQMHSELGAYAAANLAGAYDLFAEFWRVAVEEAQKG